MTVSSRILYADPCLHRYESDFIPSTRTMKSVIYKNSYIVIISHWQRKTQLPQRMSVAAFASNFCFCLWQK